MLYVKVVFAYPFDNVTAQSAGHLLSQLQTVLMNTINAKLYLQGWLFVKVYEDWLIDISTLYTTYK